MKTRIEDSVEKFHSGFNCAQAVTCTYCDIASINCDSAFEVTRKYGGGRHKLCGAVIGMYIIASAANGKEIYEDPKRWLDNDDALLKKLADEFIKKRGTLICSELPKIENGMRMCKEYVRDAAEILEKNINF